MPNITKVNETISDGASVTVPAGKSWVVSIYATNDFSGEILISDQNGNVVATGETLIEKAILHGGDIIRYSDDTTNEELANIRGFEFEI